MFKILIGIVVAAFVVIMGFLIIDPDLKSSNNNTNSINEVVTDGYRYTVEGEVNKAGTYVLSDNIKIGRAHV